MDPIDRPFTLITGASEGLGKLFVIECARRNMNILAVALPGPSLDGMHSFVEHNFQVRIHSIAADLSTEEGCHRVRNYVAEKKLRVNMLINNAGVVMTSPFHEMPLNHCMLQMQVNVVATTLLTKLFIDELLSHPSSYLLNVSSLSAFFYLPNKQMYGASKAFVYSFTRSLQTEYKDRNINITVVCPGGLSSNIRSVIANNQGGWIAQKSITSPEYVAGVSVQACLDGKRVVIPGRLNRLFLLLDKLMPAFLKDRITSSQMKQLTVKKN